MKWRTAHALRQPSLDPYFSWAQQTHWRGFRRLLGQRLGTGEEGVDHIRLLVQAGNPQSARNAMKWTGWKVAAIYRDSSLSVRHFVAEVARSKLHQLLENPPKGVSWELALPFRDAETAARAQSKGAYGPTRDALSFRPAEFLNIGPATDEGVAAGPVMGVIDFGFPFLNDAFLDDEKKTRIRALWDQGASHRPPTHPNGEQKPWPWTDGQPRNGYGRSLNKATIDQVLGLLHASSDPPGRATDTPAANTTLLDEAEMYRRMDYLIDYDDARHRIWVATHGSHVASVAAGRRDPLLTRVSTGGRVAQGAVPQAESGAASDPAMDDASDAALVLVQLPALTAADSGGGSLSAQVLDAVRYIIDAAGDGGQPIVITLSYGSFAGPHDGSSLIEQALDELIELKSGQLAIVLGAGNGRQAACHVARSVGVDRSALLRIALDPGDFTDTYVETWFKLDPTANGDEALLKRLRARVRTSEGDWSGWVGLDQSIALRAVGERRPVARLSFHASVPNGKGPLLLLAMAPTDRPADDDGPLAPAGSWQIEICLAAAPGVATGPDDARVDFESWIERDDPGWLGHGVQPRFEEQRVGDDKGTLSSLTTGQYTIAVGGFRLSDSRPAAYSSIGTQEGSPFVYAACEESALQPNIPASAVRNGDSLRMNGTSVAAPVLARRLYNHMVSRNRPHASHDNWPSVLKAVVMRELQDARSNQRPCLLALDLPEA